MTPRSRLRKRARSVCGCRAGVATGKRKLFGVIGFEEWPDRPQNGQHGHDDAGEWRQEIGVGRDPVVERTIEIIVVKSIPGSGSVRQVGWGHLDGVGRCDVDPDEEEHDPDDDPHVLFHLSLSGSRGLSLLLVVEGF